jgi:hypothetical protein
MRGSKPRATNNMVRGTLNVGHEGLIDLRNPFIYTNENKSESRIFFALCARSMCSCGGVREDTDLFSLMFGDAGDKNVL